MFALMAMLAFVMVTMFACVMAMLLTSVMEVMLACLMAAMMDAMLSCMLAVPMGSCTRTRKMTKPDRSLLFPKKGLPLLTVDFFRFIKYLFYDLSFLPSMAAISNQHRTAQIFAVLILCLAQLQEHQAEQQSGDEKLHIPFDI